MQASPEIFIHPRMLVARLRALAWIFALPTVVLVMICGVVGVGELRGLIYQLSFTEAGVGASWQPLWLVHALTLALVAFVSLAPLMLAPGEALASTRSRAQTRRAALVVGLGGGLGLWLLHLRCDAVLDQAWRAAYGASTSPEVYAWLSLLTLLGWVCVVALAQAQLIELIGLHLNKGATVKRAGTLVGAWLLALGAGSLMNVMGLDQASESSVWDVELLALVPLVVLLAVEVASRWIAGLAPRLRTRWHDQRANLRALQGSSCADASCADASFSPDPAALAQGHQLESYARSLRVVAWTLLPFMLMAWVLVYERFGHGPSRVLVALGLGLVAALPVLAFVWVERRTFMPTKRELDPPPAGLAGFPTSVALLVQVERCCELLETKADAAYREMSTHVALSVCELQPRELELFERAGASPRRLVRQLFDADDPCVPLARDRRRVLHHQLRKFAAQVRGDSELDPYRAELRGAMRALGLAWLSGGRSPLDRELSRTRVQLVAGFAGVFVAVVVVVQLLGLRHSQDPLALCIPGVGLCRLAVDSGEGALIAGVVVALTPVWLWMCARVLEWAARLSFALALPPEGELEPSSATIRGLMVSAWSSKVQIGPGERSMFRVLACAVLLLPAGLAWAELSMAAVPPDDLELALVLVPLFSAGLLMRRPLRLGIARLASRLCD